VLLALCYIDVLSIVSNVVSMFNLGTKLDLKVIREVFVRKQKHAQTTKSFSTLHYMPRTRNTIQNVSLL
jgi:hypothetical protein